MTEVIDVTHFKESLGLPMSTEKDKVLSQKGELVGHAKMKSRVN